LVLSLIFIELLSTLEISKSTKAENILATSDIPFQFCHEVIYLRYTNKTIIMPVVLSGGETWASYIK